MMGDLQPKTLGSDSDTTVGASGAKDKFWAQSDEGEQRQGLEESTTGGGRGESEL